MTDEQIIKALKCCKIGECDDCPFHGVKEDCEVELPEEVLDLINRQKAEIGELRSDKIIAESHEKAAKDLFVDCTRQLEEAKSELKQLQITLDEYPVKTLFGKNNLICSKTSEDYEKLITDISNETIKEFVERLKQDVAGIVRCRDCKYMRTIYPIKSKDKDAIEVHVCYLSHWSENSHGVSVGANDFCSYGEKN